MARAGLGMATVCAGLRARGRGRAVARRASARERSPEGAGVREPSGSERSPG